MSTQTNPTESECLAVGAAELAKLLQISERHLWNLHRQGRLGPRPISLGRATRWAVDECRAWLDAGAPDRKTWDALRAR